MCRSADPSLIESMPHGPTMCNRATGCRRGHARPVATVKSLPALKQIRDQAEALSRYTKQRQYGLEIENDAAEIRLMAERRLGDLLKAMERAQQTQGRPKKKAYHDDTLIAPPTLEDLGITRLQSSRWQQEATVPEAAFQTYVAETRAKGEALTSADVLREARPFLPPVSAAPAGGWSC